jgi:PhoH-like ATPase
VGKADNQILGIVMALKELHPERSVILVSKDINMRIKARALGLDAEDYFNDKVLQDSTCCTPAPVKSTKPSGSAMART